MGIPRAHVSVKPGSRLEVRLDTQRQDGWRAEHRRSVGMLCNHAGRRLYAMRFVERPHYSEGDGRETRCLAQTMAGRQQRASLAWSCNIPDHDDGAKSTALNCSTASPVRAWSCRRNRTHTPRQRRRAQPEELVSQNPSSSSLEAFGGLSQAEDRVWSNLATAAGLPAHGFPTLPNDERQNG